LTWKIGQHADGDGGGGGGGEARPFKTTLFLCVSDFVNELRQTINNESQTVPRLNCHSVEKSIRDILF
jgi:hypothetical protein